MRTIIDVYQNKRPQFGKSVDGREIRKNLDALMTAKGLDIEHADFVSGSGFILNRVYASHDTSVVMTHNDNIIGRNLEEGAHVVISSLNQEFASSIANGVREIYERAAYTHELHKEFNAI